MSISETLPARERTDGTKWDWSALPVFLSRGHHWHTLYVNTAAGIKRIADLRGKRIGVPDYDPDRRAVVPDQVSKRLTTARRRLLSATKVRVTLHASTADRLRCPDAIRCLVPQI
jgi:hypothetical protein